MFVVSGLERGGAEAQLVRVASGLDERGWEVGVLSYLPFSPDSWTHELKNSTVRTFSLMSGTGIGRYLALIRAGRTIRCFAPDVLVGFMFHGIMTARILGWLCRVRANVSAIRTERDHPPREWLLGLTNRLTDAVTIMSRSLADDLIRRRVITSAHTHVIPNSIDIASFDVAEEHRLEVRRELAVTDEQFLWLAAGRLVRAKDYPNLLRGFSELVRRNDRARLVVAGDGPLRNELGSMIEHLQLGDRVRLLGLRCDMPELYAASDALVLSSAWEGMPGVVLEAMASKKPVVSTSVGAVPELLVGDAGRFLVPPGDPVALADAMERMMELPDGTRNEIAEAGYLRVRAEFSVSRIISMWEGLFLGLISKGHDRSRNST